MILRQLIETPDSSARPPDALQYGGCVEPRMETLAWLRLSVETRADQAIVTMVGEVDIACTTALELRLSGLLELGFVKIVADLTGVEFCDVHAFGMLARVSRRAAQRGGWLRVAGMRPRVGRVIDIVRLTQLLPAYRTVSDALADRTGVVCGSMVGRA